MAYHSSPSRIPCPNRGCKNTIKQFLKTDAIRLCRKCSDMVIHYLIPYGGFIPSPALRKIASELIKERDRESLSEAVKMMRGPRYPVGPWEERPVPRLLPLLHGRWNRRLPHLLVGRKHVPSKQAIAMAFVHSVLGRTVLEQHSMYCQYLRGATYFGTRGLFAPAGQKIDAGANGKSIYRLPWRDLKVIGTHVKRAAERAGMSEKDRTLVAWITTRYLQGVESGEFNPPVYLPWGSMRTKMSGDHIFACRLPIYSPKVPAKYRGKIIRADGKVEHHWPHDLWLNEQTQAPSIPKEQSPRPSTDWLFNS